MIDINKLESIEIDLSTFGDKKVFNDTPEKMNIKTQNFTFETLYIPKNNLPEGQPRKIFVLLSSGGRIIPDTRFDRWSIYGYCNADIICVEDPMYKLYKKMTTGWYFGTKEHSIVHELKQIIDKILQDRSIDKKNICIIGSSCGAYAGLYLTNLIRGCTCIAMNPQIIVSNWGKSSVTLEKRTGMSLTGDKDDFKRNNISYIADDHESRYFITVNRLVKRDWDLQLSIFMDKLKPAQVSGEPNVYARDNFTIYISGNPYTRPHWNVIDSCGLIMMNEIIRAEKVDYTAVQTLMTAQEKVWENNDSHNNLLSWNDFFKDIKPGCRLLFPFLEKNKAVMKSFGGDLTLTMLTKKKFKIMNVAVTLKDKALFDEFMKVFESENLDELEMTSKAVTDNVLKFVVTDNLRKKFIRISALINKFLMLKNL